MRSRDEGFTLVETLVALAISAIAIVSLLQLFGATSDATFRNRNRTLAELHMSSLVAQTDVLVTQGTRELSGDFSSDFRWQIKSVPVASEVALKNSIAVRQITYSVHWREGRRVQELALTSERILAQ
jgi:type II secretion system protein I